MIIIGSAYQKTETAYAAHPSSVLSIKRTASSKQDVDEFQLGRKHKTKIAQKS